MQWKKRIFSLLKQFDLFGETFTFKIHKNSSYTSVIGGISSLAFVLYTLLFFFTNLRDFFSKTIRFSTIENLISPEVNLNFSNHSYFMMAFCLRDSKMGVDSFLSSKISQKISLYRDRLENKRLVRERRPLEMEVCREEFFDQNMSEIYSQMDFTGCQCLNLTNQKEDISLMSKPNGVERDYIQYELEYKMSNETGNDSYLESTESKLYVYFPSYEVGSTNIDYPFQMSPIVEVFDVKPFTQVKSALVFSLINLYDHNSLFDDTQYDQDNRISFQKADTKFSYHPQTNKNELQTLVKIQIQMDMNIINHNRRVLRYDDFLGNMVGYIYNIVIPIYIFNVMYNSFGAREYFAEKFFFKNQEFSKKISQEIKNKICKLRNTSGSSSSRENFSEVEFTNDLKEYENAPKKTEFVQLNEEIDTRPKKVAIEIENKEANEKSVILKKRDERNNFKYNYLEYVLYNFCFCKSKKLMTKNKMLENSIDFFDYYLDVKSYVKRMIEFDLIKLIIFQNKPEDLAVLESFAPLLKEDSNYLNFSKQEELYANHFTMREQNEILENCKNMKTTDIAFYNALLTYFN